MNKKRKSIDPETVFLDTIKKLIKNLLIDNINYTNGYYPYSELHGELHKDTKERAKCILEEIDNLSHLIDINYYNKLEKKVEDIKAIVGDTPELNMCNYTEEEVSEVNDAMTEIYNICEE